MTVGEPPASVTGEAGGMPRIMGGTVKGMCLGMAGNHDQRQANKGDKDQHHG